VDARPQAGQLVVGRRIAGSELGGSLELG